MDYNTIVEIIWISSSDVHVHKKKRVINLEFKYQNNTVSIIVLH